MRARNRTAIESPGRALRIAGLALVGLAALAATACRQDMHDQAKYEPLEPSVIFANGMASRPLIEGTVARGHLRADPVYYSGIGPDGQFVDALPMAMDVALLERGQSRFDVFCAPCHGRRGDGKGMIVQRGFKQPTSFHDPRIRGTALGQFYDIMTNGFGEMSNYSSQISPEDRWAIAAYMRALQLSRNAPVGQLSDQDLHQLEALKAPAAAGTSETH